MADGGPLERQDIVSDDALKAPGILTEEFQKLLDKLDDVVKKSQEYGNAFSTADASTAKLKESTAGLSDEQKVLGQITTQINTLIAKQSDEYIEQVGVLNNLKQATKDKTALGDQEAQSITRENSSRNQLLAALNSNRAAYSNLRTEQERNSPEGQKLLKTIQDQDKGFKDLSRSMGDNKQLVGGYRSELQELVEKFGAVSPEIREVTEKTSLLGKIGEAALSPLGLTIGVIAAAVGITKAALDVFYEDSIQGADRLNSRFNSWQAILEVAKDSLFDLGKTADGVLGGISDWLSKAAAYALGGAQGIAEVSIKTEKLNQVSELQNDIKKEEIKLTVEVATLELEKSEELYIARDKANQQLEVRYEALQKAKVLTQEDANVKIAAVNNEILLQQKLISVNTTKSVVGLTANQILAQANTLGRVNYEQLTKLAELEAQRLNIQTQTNLGARRNQALDASLIDEAIKRIDTQKKAELDAYNKGNEEIVKSDLAYNERLIADNKVSYEVKITAIDQNIANEAVLNDFAKAQAIQAEREKTASIITLTKEEHASIEALVGDDLDAKASMERKYKLADAENDATFKNTKLLLENEYQTKEQEIIKKGDQKKVLLAREYHKQITDIEFQVSEAFVTSAKTINDNIYQSQQAAINARLTALQDGYNQEVALVGNNAVAKTAIDKKYAADQKALTDEAYQLKVKQAKFDKAATLIQLGIKEGFAIAELLPLLANPATAAAAQVQLGKVIALATLEEAAVAAKPIPQYEFGTTNHPGGPAILGDGGKSELFKTPQGVAGLSPSHSTLIDLPKGSEVFTGNLTTQMLAMMGLNVPERLDRVQKLDNSIVKELQKTNQLLSKPQLRQSSLASDGIAIVESYRNAEGLLKRIRKNVMIG